MKQNEILELLKIFEESAYETEIDNRIVATRERNILVTSYHPELTSNTQVHHYFINNLVLNRKK